jgi:hypothetical protein
MNSMPGLVEVDRSISVSPTSALLFAAHACSASIVCLSEKSTWPSFFSFSIKASGGKPNKISSRTLLSLLIAPINEGSIARADHLMPAKEGLERPNKSNSPIPVKKCLLAIVGFVTLARHGATTPNAPSLFRTVAAPRKQIRVSCPPSAQTSATRTYTETHGRYTLDQKLTSADGKEVSYQIHYRNAQGCAQAGSTPAGTTHTASSS